MSPPQELLLKIAIFFSGFASGAIIMGLVSIFTINVVFKKYIKELNK